MKSTKKQKFDPGRIKSFFILHGEKVALVFFVLVALYIAYLGTQYKPLDWQPTALQQAAQSADDHIKTNKRKALDEGVSIFTYDTYAAWIKAPVKPDLYKTNIQWMPPLFPEKVKRGALTKEQLFTVRDLKAGTGLGGVAINLTSEAATLQNLQNPQVGKHWAVITGLIPVKEQLDIYVNTYSTSVAPDPERDTPLYWFYKVERAEVEPGMNVENLNWEELDFLPTFLENMNLWAGTAPDPVDPTYVAPVHFFPMEYPLPPIDKPFAEEVAHPPTVPLLTQSQMQQVLEMEQLQERKMREMFQIKTNDLLNRDMFGDPANRRGDSGGTKDGDDAPKPLLVTDYLFRFFDFSVKSGKSYRYRVKLLLANPNYGLEENVLMESDLAKERFIETDPSEASNMVTIPLQSRVLATSVIPPSARTPWFEPFASLMAVHFEMEDGSEWCVDIERVFRGQTINYPNREVKNFAQDQKADAGVGGPGAPGGLGGNPQPPRGGPKPPAPRPGAKPPGPVADDSKKTVDILSDVCVLDMMGGVGLIQTSNEALGLKSPGKILVLEPSGNMVLRKVEVDETEVELLKNPEKPTGGRLGAGGRGMGAPNPGGGPGGMGQPVRRPVGGRP